MNHSTRILLALGLALAATGALPAQGAGTGQAVPDLTFPEFIHGDGRQKLSEFEGQPVLVVQFADVFSGLGALRRAIGLHEKHGHRGLVVIATRIDAGGTYGDGTANVDLGAWFMKRFPSADIRICDRVRATWDWQADGMPPNWAVIAPDGTLVDAGSEPKRSSDLAPAVESAMQQLDDGWGQDKSVAKARGLLYGKGQLVAAREAAAGKLDDEVAAAFARRLAAVEWLRENGEWLRAAADLETLRKSVSGDAKLTAAVDATAERFADDTGQRELALARKLQKLTRPLTRKKPGKGADRRLRAFAEKHPGTTVGERAARIADRVAQAVDIR